MAMVVHIRFYIEIYPEAISTDLIWECTQKCTGIDWCELGWQTLRKVTLFPVNQHI
jgi:hypothetical protein